MKYYYTIRLDGGYFTHRYTKKAALYVADKLTKELEGKLNSALKPYCVSITRYNRDN